MCFYHWGDPPPFEGLPEPVVKFLTLINSSQLWLLSARGVGSTALSEKEHQSKAQMI